MIRHPPLSFWCLWLMSLGVVGWSQQVSCDEPVVEFSVTPAATGRQIVRASVPIRPGLLASGEAVLVSNGQRDVLAAIRPVSWHQDGANSHSMRRAILTFPYTFDDHREVKLSVSPAPAEVTETKNPAIPLTIKMEGGIWTLTYRGGFSIRARPIWPDEDPSVRWQRETVEENAYYRWERWLHRANEWSRIVEIRADSSGQVVAVAHLQRRERAGSWAPKFGWDLVTFDHEQHHEPPTAEFWQDEDGFTLRHSFASPHPHRDDTYELKGYRLGHPAAAGKRRGEIFTRREGTGRLRYRYLRSNGDDRVPQQPFAWRRAEFVVSPSGVPLPTPTLTSPHTVHVNWRDWDALYGCGPPLELTDTPLLAKLTAYHRDAIVACGAVGSDWGNVSGYRDGRQHGTVFGMNRLNHCPPMLFEAMRSGDRRLAETALAWCDNFHDLTIWWGPKQTGGTRYNNLRATNETPPDDDWSFMWRGDKSTTFCTKGYDSFLLAYEETGDPRMRAALEAQLAYASQYVHCDDGECRNIGDVADFVRLYESTGEDRYLQQALRLFRELRTKLNNEHLFDQSGQPIVDQPGYIDDDEMGKKYPFAKPYIIGYALSGCPRLARYAAHEADLMEMIEAVADFLADSQDPIGGWRYPHPKSSRVITCQAMEHAWQLVQASQLLGAKPAYLDAIERTLRLRLWTWKTTGKIANNLLGWEASTGSLEHPQDIYSLYKLPDDRDGTRDYRDGRLGLGASSPEGLIYCPEVLRFYLQHRPASRLQSTPDPHSPLGQVLSRINKSDFETIGVRDKLPIFRGPLAERLTFPLAWCNSRELSFAAWRERAKRRVHESLLTAPPAAPFAVHTVGVRHHGNHTSRKIIFNLTADSRVPAYLLIPSGEGPFPAVLLLHDHGAEFRIGKEKVVQPWSDGTDRAELARAWVDEYYGGRFLGNELARRGYVCLAVDALNWSDRGGAGFDGQQALASNLMHLGSSLAGLIAHEDLRAAEFLASQPEVDRERVAAMGLSMGSFRAWQVTALSDHICAGVAICWMATVKGLMVPGNNHTQGHSAYTMNHPGLWTALDYPDVASIACPKPMLFYNGRRDKLFPVASVEEAYMKMDEVWRSQGAADRLVTKLWDVPHEFNRQMQHEAIAWLDAHLRPSQISK